MYGFTKKYRTSSIDIYVYNQHHWSKWDGKVFKIMSTSSTTKNGSTLCFRWTVSGENPWPSVTTDVGRTSFEISRTTESPETPIVSFNLKVTHSDREKIKNRIHLSIPIHTYTHRNTHVRTHTFLSHTNTDVC